MQDNKKYHVLVAMESMNLRVNTLPLSLADAELLIMTEVLGGADYWEYRVVPALTEAGLPNE